MAKIVIGYFSVLKELVKINDSLFCKGPLGTPTHSTPLHSTPFHLQYNHLWVLDSLCVCMSVPSFKVNFSASLIIVINNRTQLVSIDFVLLIGVLLINSYK